MGPLREIYDVEAVARHFGKSPKTILRMISAGRINAAKVGRSWCIHRDTIEAMDQQIRQGNLRYIGQ